MALEKKEAKKIEREQIANFYDKEAAEYDKNYSSPVCLAEDKIIASLTAPYIKGRVLDIGCGTGSLLNYFSPQEYYGLDISEKMIEKARAKYPKIIFSVGDMHNMPYSAKNFDTIVSFYGPMSYSLDPNKLLAEFSRVLAPGGTIMIMPYTKRVEHSLFLGGYSPAINRNISKIYYSSETLHKLFKNCPYFENVKIFGINYFVNYLEYAIKQYGNSYVSDFYYDLLLKELQNYDLPIEYARHALVIANKK